MSSKNYQNNQKAKGICRCIERQKNFSNHFLRITVLALLLILFSITSAFAVSYEVENDSCPNVPWSDYYVARMCATVSGGQVTFKIYKGTNTPFGDYGVAQIFEGGSSGPRRGQDITYNQGVSYVKLSFSLNYFTKGSKTFFGVVYPHTNTPGEGSYPSGYWTQGITITATTTMPNSEPTVSMTSCPSGTLTSSSYTFRWSGYDSDGSVSQYYYGLDDSSPDSVTTATSYAWTNLSNGSHTFYVKAKDNSGAYSSIESCNFYVNVSPVNQQPTVSMTSCPSGTLTSSSYTFRWSGYDSDGSVSQYYYGLDDSSPDSVTTATSYAWTNLSNGSHTFYVKAKDNSGAYSSIESCNFYVNVSPVNQQPTVSMTSCPSGTLTSSSYTFRWSGYDSDGSVSQYYYGLDDSSPDSVTTATSYAWTNLSNGSHTFYVKAKDNSGAYSSIESCNFYVNVSPVNQQPTVSITNCPWAALTTSSYIFSWSGSDDGYISQYYYGLDDSSPDIGTSATSYAWTNLSNGNHVFYVKAKDNSGSYSDVASCSFNVNVASVQNTAPQYVTGTVNPNPGTSGGNFTFETSWKDAENDNIVNVKVHYRKQGTTTWSESLLDSKGGNPPVFSKVLKITGTAGVYEYQFQASDANPADGQIRHTTAWQEIKTFEIKTVSPSLNVFRVWIDKNYNGNYDSGEGVEGAHVFVNAETTERGVTKDGFIQLSNIKSTDKIYAYKEFYSVEHPRAIDSNFGGQSSNNPFFASNDAGKMEGKSYRFVMASDIMDDDPGNERGKYYDFPGKNKTLQDSSIQRDSESNILVKLVHPMIEWNLVFAFESPHGDDFYAKLKSGIQSYADYMYNFTDGYSVVRNVVLVKKAHKYSIQWEASDVQIENASWPRATIFGNTKDIKAHLYMGKIWITDSDDPKIYNYSPDSTRWYSTLGHESGHYLLGFYDEYMNGNGSKGANDAPEWDYRDEHDGNPETESNEFPSNYGIMDHQNKISEMSDCTDYVQRTKPYNVDEVTRQYYKRSKSTWDFFKTHFQKEIKDHMDGQGFFDDFFANLIIPPHTTGSYPLPKNMSGTKRPYKEMSHDNKKVNIIEWTLPNAPAEKIFAADVKVVDDKNNPIKWADVYLGKAYQGKTNSKGVLTCDSFDENSFNTQKLEVSYKTGKNDITIVKKSDTYTVTLPSSAAANRSKGKRDSENGIIISAKPDSVNLKGIIVTASGKKLNSVPMLRLSQSNGYSADISMLVSGDAYSGSAEYLYDSGLIEFSGMNNLTPIESINPFEVFSTDSGPVSGYYAPHGELEMTYSSDSFSGSGRFVILNSILAAPPNGNLIHVGNVWSFGFEDSIGTVRNVGFNIKLYGGQGLDASQLNLYGWDEVNKQWQIIPGGTNNLKVFSIRMDSLDYVSYALFAPLSDDVSPPSPVTGLQAKTGSSGWSVELQWIAPNDDRGVYVYDVRYNTVPITEENWYSSFEVGYVPKPTEAGAAQSFIIEMPDPNTDYYFAIRSSDAAGNKSVMTTLSSPTKSRTPYQTVNAGTFTVDSTGIVKIDWLYDGGKYQGEFGIFSIAGMENLTPGSSEFIAEAVKRVLSNSEQGYLVFSDLSEGARFSGILGNEIRDWNAGPYKGVKSFPMKPGSCFATVLVPNSTFSSLSQNPATTDTNKRPLFSSVSANPAYGMTMGQMADVNGMGKAYSYEDKNAETSDRDFNDLIVQITGATGDLPTIDSLRSDRSSRDKREYGDWRDSAFGQLILEHVEASEITETTPHITVTLASSAADMVIYDPQKRFIGKDGGTIPGAAFEMKSGVQIVSLSALIAGDYRIVLRSVGDGGSGSLGITGFVGSTQVASEQMPFEIAAHQSLDSVLSADAFLSSQTLAVEIPGVSELGYDFNGDGVTDNADVALIVRHWNSCRNQQKYDPFFDLNDDGCITVADVMKVLNAKTVK